MRLWLLAAVLLAALIAPAQAQPDHRGEALRISLLTFAPGKTYWQRFGHNAILVENTATGANAVYNYGMFDFFQKNFFLNFARGHMVYRLDVDTLDRTLRLYASEGRWVYQQVLALDAAQRLQMARFLETNARPENAEYRYDYFRDNCSTRVRDAIDRVLGGTLVASLKSQPVAVTYRHEATRLMRPILPLALGMDAIMGPAGDTAITRQEQSFVPEMLMQAVAEQRINGQPLVAEARYLLTDANSPVAPALPLRWAWTAFGIGLAFAGALALLGRADARGARLGFGLIGTLILLTMGVFGFFMLAAWTLTEHWSMAANWNLLLFSPLAWLLLPAVWRGSPRLSSAAMRGLAWLMLFGAALGLIGPQHNLAWIALWLPIHLALAYGLLRRS
ncbi:MAG: DUF4105 domain-containing protein [Pseudomonadota bacterium]